MNIWKILEIEPTTDRKAIRRAYAARSKETHPEEKPEEFRMLYEAYQKALEYAKRGGESASFVAEEELELELELEKEQKQEETDEPLFSYFEKNLKERTEQVREFCQRFRAFSRERRTPELREWWAQYLYTEEFQRIKWHPDIIKLFIEELEKRFTFEKDFKLLLWDAYQFQKEESEYSEDIQTLYHILHTEYEMKIAMDLLQIQREENKKRWKRNFLIAGILLLICGPILIYYQVTKEERLAASYLRSTYPGVEFSGPEKSGYSYYFETPAHPDFRIRVDVPSLDKCDATDDYAVQLLSYYAKQYGLSCGDVLWKATLYYPDINDIENFCDTVLQMFEEQEELQVLTEIGICPENILYPEVMIRGGVYNFSYPVKQLYPVAELADNYDHDYLAAQVLEAYIVYMFNYEAWNLTDGQYVGFGPVYEKFCEEASFYGGDWYSVYNGEEKVCGLFVPYYSSPDSMGYNVDNMTIGNVYHHLLMRGVPITVKEDGSGFLVGSGSNETDYGVIYGTSVELNELNKFY